MLYDHDVPQFHKDAYASCGIWGGLLWQISGALWAPYANAVASKCAGPGLEYEQLSISLKACIEQRGIDVISAEALFGATAQDIRAFFGTGKALPQEEERVRLVREVRSFNVHFTGPQLVRNGLCTCLCLHPALQQTSSVVLHAMVHQGHNLK
jgi:hypothetical protein